MRRRLVIVLGANLLKSFRIDYWQRCTVIRDGSEVTADREDVTGSH